MFKPTYLYVKTHNKTGLKYFGKTTKVDPFKYKGSGTRWLRHLKAHGNDVSTEIVGVFDDETWCSLYAIEFSVANNIVESAEWANLTVETGVDGQDDQHMVGARSARTKKSFDQSANTMKSLYGSDYFSRIASAPKSDTTKEKLRAARLAYNALHESPSKSPSKGLVREKFECPHCNGKFAKNILVRFHLDKCKNNGSVSESGLLI